MKIFSLVIAATLVAASLVEGLPQPILDAEGDWVPPVEAQADYDMYARAVKPSSPPTVATSAWATFTSTTAVEPSSTPVKPPKPTRSVVPSVKPPKPTR
ncbi:hypothetical protein BGZ97_005236, partial [Linnemannia gamsii]